MDFRYRLAKKTFKNKKTPQKRATGMDVISQDQRGDDSSPEVSPLSLDRQTITPKPQLPEEEKQLSRRDLFSFGSCGFGVMVCLSRLSGLNSGEESSPR